MKKYLTELDLKVIDQRRLLERLCNEFEIYHPQVRRGIDAVAYVLRYPIWRVERCLTGTWWLSFEKWKKLERATGGGMWDRFYFYEFTVLQRETLRGMN